MVSFVKRLLKLRIIRYGMVGGIGIPINDLALFGFKFLFVQAISNGFLLYAVASACAFEVSNIVNFVLNQFFTYREQIKGIHGWEWVRRAAKGQLTSLSALLLSYGVGLLLVGVFHVNDYLATPIGIVCAFIYNFFISNKLVFRATATPTPSDLSPMESNEEDSLRLRAISKIESTPK